jgi:hypothetical protein
MSAPADVAGPFRLLITGSRRATPAMLATARKAVERAKANGWEIVVGDASGVDTAVVNACKELQVFGECYGIAPQPRCELNEYMNYERIDYHYVHGRLDHWRVPGADYLERDRRMVQHCHRCLAIWDGSSRGTRYTFQYAQKLGKQVDVLNFGERK